MWELGGDFNAISTLWLHVPLIESVLSFNIITLYGNVCAKNKIKRARVVKTASRLISNEQKHLSSIYNDALKTYPFSEMRFSETSTRETSKSSIS